MYGVHIAIVYTLAVCAHGVYPLIMVWGIPQYHIGAPIRPLMRGYVPLWYPSQKGVQTPQMVHIWGANGYNPHHNRVQSRDPGDPYTLTVCTSCRWWDDTPHNGVGEYPQYHIGAPIRPLMRGYVPPSVPLWGPSQKGVQTPQMGPIWGANGDDLVVIITIIPEIGHHLLRDPGDPYPHRDHGEHGIPGGYPPDGNHSHYVP